MRLFVAVEVCPEVRKKLLEIQEEFQRTSLFLNKAKWVKPENLHLTLKFLGEVSQENLNTLRSALIKSIQGVKSFEIEIQGLGCFPQVKSVRLLWAGVSQGAGQLKKLAEEVEKNTASAGFAPSDKTFSPHLTLARFPSYSEKRMSQHLSNFSKKISSYNSLSFGKTTVSKIDLIESVLSASGPHYTALEEFHFPCNSQ